MAILRASSLAKVPETKAVAEVPLKFQEQLTSIEAVVDLKTHLRNNGSQEAMVCISVSLLSVFGLFKYFFFLQYRFLLKRARQAARLSQLDPFGKAIRGVVRVHFDDVMLAQMTVSGSGVSEKKLSLMDLGLMAIYVDIMTALDPEDEHNLPMKLKDFVFCAQSRLNQLQVRLIIFNFSASTPFTQCHPVLI